MRWPAALFVLLAVGLALLATWPAGDAVATRPFQAPELVQVEHPGGVGLVRNLSTGGGRIRAKAELDVVFRWLVDPVELLLEEPAGRLALMFGKDEQAAAALLIDPAGMRLTVRRADGTTAGAALPAPRPDATVALRYDGAAYLVEVDGAPAGEPVVGPAPSGAARIGMEPGSSFAALSCRIARGDERTIRGEDLSGGLERTAWAGITALLGALALLSWGRTVIFGRRGGAGAWLLCAAVVGALVAGALTALERHNAARLRAAPQPCETRPFAPDHPLALRPGKPFSLDPRRDGDFVLDAQVELAPDSVLDVVVRAAKPNNDQGVIVTLSTDVVLPSGIARNLGTAFHMTDGAAALRRLEPHRRYALRVVCDGPDTTATLDGRELASTRDYDLRAGHVALLALRGQATVEALRLEPTGQPEPLRGALVRWQLLTAAGLVAGLLALLAATGRRTAGVLWAWPLAAATSSAAPDGALLAGALASATLLLLTPRRGRRLAAWLLGGGVVALTCWALLERPPVVSSSILNAMNLEDVRGGPIAERYLWARHPLCRRFSHYVHRQQFRRGPFEPDKRPGVPRIITLGSSSTFGYGVGDDQTFSAQLERALAGQGVETEVLNAGVSGSTAAKLELLLTGALLDLRPDLVIVDLSFNDHIHGATYDERAHFRRMADDGIGLLGQAWAHLALHLERRGQLRMFALHREGAEIPAELLRRHSLEPAERFAQSLREMIAAARAAGAEVVLVQEPTNPERGSSPIGAFHDAMARVGDELDVLVVAPQAALDRAPGEAFLDQVHPTPLGHRIIARVLAEELARAGLVGG